jgi:hypothetical protein
MRLAPFALLLAILFVVAAILPPEASAVPIFARKYGFNCTMCHSAVPRLNDFGARYRANGYRLPGRENIEKTVMESPAPVAFRTSVAYTYDEYQHAAEEAPPKQSTLELDGLDILSAGLLGTRIGYMMVFVPSIAADRGVAGQDAALEMASVVFSRIAATSLGLRVGRFEPAYVAFSAKRHLSVTPYEIYEYSFPGGPPFTNTQTGLEVTGSAYGPVRFAAGLVAGSATNLAKDPPRDGYVRLEGVLGAGEGQTAGHRFGVTGYFGTGRPEAPADPAADAESFNRVGADASLNVRGFNLALQYLRGEDQKPLWEGLEEKASWSGGFAELSYTSDFHVVGFARFDLVQQPCDIDQDITRATIGGRYYFEDHLAAHLEGSRRTVAASQGDDETEDFVTARLDVIF